MIQSMYNSFGYLCKCLTPLKIYNGTPEGVPLEIQGRQLPINKLNGTPFQGRVPFQIFIGVNFQ